MSDFEIVRREDFSAATYLLEVRHPLGVRPAVPDRPRPSEQRPGLVEVRPHPTQHPLRQEVGVHIGEIHVSSLSVDSDLEMTATIKIC